jgi:hypothetical protein
MFAIFHIFTFPLDQQTNSKHFYAGLLLRLQNHSKTTTVMLPRQSSNNCFAAILQGLWVEVQWRSDCQALISRLHHANPVANHFPI